MYRYMYIHIPHFVFPITTAGHLSCFHLLAIVNSAAMNNVMQVFKYLFSISLGIYPRVEFLGHIVILYLTF